MPALGLGLGLAVPQRGANSLFAAGITRYSAKSWSDLTDFAVTGTNPTIVSGGLRFAAAYGNFDTQRILLSAIHTDRDFSFTAKIRMVNVTDFGLGVGWLSSNAWSGQAWSAVATLRPVVLSNCAFYPQFSGVPGAAISPVTGSPPAISAGDVIIFRFRVVRGALTARIQNLTTSVEGSWTAVNNINTGRAGICGLGSTFDVLEIEHVADTPSSPQCIAIGDSKTYGPSGSFASYADILTTNGTPCAIFAGPSDRTVELVQSKSDFVTTGASVAVMCIGRNDLASSVASGTWQANYSSIVTDLKNAGMSVVHLVIPEITQDQTTLKTWLNSTYPSDTREYLTGWVNGTHLGVDNTHPNTTGQTYIESILRPIIQSLL